MITSFSQLSLALDELFSLGPNRSCYHAYKELYSNNFFDVDLVMKVNNSRKPTNINDRILPQTKKRNAMWKLTQRIPLIHKILI
eukprot:snap_masked-scaffold_59-processed-gene-0.69-mRNA-1 protein AED:1.00 eAED:1.00 QI:0/0/0/0/1/1/4/0/83